MGMFCTLFLNIDGQFKIIKIIKEEIMKNKIIRLYDSLDHVNSRECKSNNFEVTFDAFSISLNKLSDKAKVFKTEEYGFAINSEIYFNVFQNEVDWESQLFKFLSIILQHYSTNCAFEYCGDVAFIRKSDTIIVDESRTERLAKFPYEELKLRFCEGTIVLN